MWGVLTPPVVSSVASTLAWGVHSVDALLYCFWRNELFAQSTRRLFLLRAGIIMTTYISIAFVPVNLAHFMDADLVLGIVMAFLIVWYVEMIICGMLHPQSTTTEYLALVGISILRSEGILVIIVTSLIVLFRLLDFARSVDMGSMLRNRQLSSSAGNALSLQEEPSTLSLPPVLPLVVIPVPQGETPTLPPTPDQPQPAQDTKLPPAPPPDIPPPVVVSVLPSLPPKRPLRRAEVLHIKRPVPLPIRREPNADTDNASETSTLLVGAQNAPIKFVLGGSEL